ncbi:hypothetical protein Oweho_3253 [Owenweeksia hongkongensis DSM 17368]|uniref:Terminase small subunit n=1 Tax=Owenweeksia hongkongensis (strain DSM 17368 / CIP 108786 / JCM 12287 / NRRL B-23963 / UST20020801) TaxID=926562 RepID=G8R4A4_OWEHD|nr:hypothetical protein [Owenweeksia hongkongensis]AEV34204.1 hypothetical protein Oweho_3253 [Owenweeksia hongkongensis DSM 17368]
MTNKEEAFLQYYIANGSNTGRKAELYRLAFGKEAEGKKDSSLETYAKRLLATKEAKDYIKQHRPNDVVRSEQLLDAIRDLKELEQAKDHKVADVLAIKREIRLHLSDLAKCIDVVEQSRKEEYSISNVRFTLTIPLKGQEGKEEQCYLASYIQELIKANKSKLLLVNAGEVKEIKFMGNTSGEMTAQDVEESLKEETFSFALKAS